MENKIIEQIKNKFEKMDSKEQIRIEKREIKENEKENKRRKKVKKGTKKVYYEIWKQILKNVDNSCFNVCINVVFDGEKTLYVTKIRIDKNIKKITNIPFDKNYLEYLLKNDGLCLDRVSRDGIKYKNESLYIIPVARFILRGIIERKEKSKQLLKNN